MVLHSWMHMNVCWKTTRQVHYAEFFCLVLSSHLSWKNIMHVTHVNCIHLHSSMVILHRASLQELIKQGLEILVVKSCSQFKKDTEHIGSSNFLQPPQYLIIIVNRFRNNGTTKNKTLIPEHQRIESGQFTFELHAVIDHHGQLLSSGHSTAQVRNIHK